MPYEPRNPHHLRYETDKAPNPKMLKMLTDYVLRLNRALGYDFNTVEFAVRDGVPYAIDFCNPAPDAEASSVGAENFEWVVETAANYAIERALAQQDGQDNLSWGSFISNAAVPQATRGRKTNDTTAVTGRKRGRPALPKTAADTTPKKRGRPAKAKADTDATPKKRGRPAKIKTEAELNAAPKKRGRKPKAALTDKAGSKVPAKRGRKPATNKPIRQKGVKIEKPFGDLIGIEAVLAAEKMMGKKDGNS
jgi:hypothetical protein